MTEVRMVDFVPVLLVVYGLVSVLKPEWMMAVYRRQKAAGTANRPGDIEPSAGAYALNYVAGIGFTIFGLIFTLRSL